MKDFNEMYPCAKIVKSKINVQEMVCKNECRLPSEKLFIIRPSYKRDPTRGDATHGHFSSIADS